MGKFIDLTGKRFGRLTVIEIADVPNAGQYYWHCICDCGNEKNIAGSSLRSGRTKSCGCWQKEARCLSRNLIDMTGQKFGHLTVIKKDKTDKRGEMKWLCQCDCGNPQLISILGSNLRTGHTQSCGCDRRSHGEIAIYNLLKQNNIPFIQEYHAFKFSSGRWASYDFYVNNKYIIEYDGQTHYLAYMHGWHTPEQLKAQQERDLIKNQWCKQNNIPLIRIPYIHLKDLCIEDLLLETSTYILPSINNKLG